MAAFKAIINMVLDRKYTYEIDYKRPIRGYGNA